MIKEDKSGYNMNINYTDDNDELNSSVEDRENIVIPNIKGRKIIINSQKPKDYILKTVM
jgi:hypothetical protein